MPLVILGEGWSQQIIIQNVDTTVAATGTITFYTKDGQPWQVPMGSRGTSNVFLINLPVGQAAVYETAVDFNAQRLGWAEISLSSAGLGDILVQTLFRKRNPGGADFMTSVMGSHKAFDSTSTYFDNTNGNYTGMGILTSEICTLSSCADVPLRVTIKTLDGRVLSTKTITQKKGVLRWMNLATDFPETNGLSGTFRVEPVNSFGSYLSSFSLQFGAGGAFTAITPYED